MFARFCHWIMQQLEDACHCLLRQQVALIQYNSAISLESRPGDIGKACSLWRPVATIGGSVQLIDRHGCRTCGQRHCDLDLLTFP